jgi:hypothetical protein
MGSRALGLLGSLAFGHMGSRALGILGSALRLIPHHMRAEGNSKTDILNRCGWMGSESYLKGSLVGLPKSLQQSEMFFKRKSQIFYGFSVNLFVPFSAGANFRVTKSRRNTGLSGNILSVKFYLGGDIS